MTTRRATLGDARSSASTRVSLSIVDAQGCGVYTQHSVIKTGAITVDVLRPSQQLRLQQAQQQQQ